MSDQSDAIEVKGERGEGFTIVSWNINGMRSLDMREILEQRLPSVGLKPSLLLVQETKLTRSQLEESQALVKDYTSYFAFSRNRAGYSGVATYCKSTCTPVKAEDSLCGTVDKGTLEGDGIGYNPELEGEELADAKFGDNDGRTVITQHVVETPEGGTKLLNVFNLYCPRLRDDPDDPVNNRQFKQTFHAQLAARARRMVEAGEWVLIVGDLNVSHDFLDQSEHTDRTKFIKTEFRAWMDDLLSEDNSTRFWDTFRVLHPTREGAYTCWNTRLNTRQFNCGARIDYIIANSGLVQYLSDAEVHQSVMGSDHCPVSATFHSVRLKGSGTVPPLATKFFPEFYGKQQKLVDMFKKRESAVVPKMEKVQPEKRKRTGPTSKKQTSLADFLLKKPKTDMNVNLSLSGEKSLSGAGEEKESDSNTFQEEADEGARNGNNTPTQADFEYMRKMNTEASTAWRQLLKTPEIPVCSGHKQKCVLRTVKKAGINQGRKFWACPRGTGQANNPESNCNFFKFASSKS